MNSEAFVRLAKRAGFTETTDELYIRTGRYVRGTGSELYHENDRCFEILGQFIGEPAIYMFLRRDTGTRMIRLQDENPMFVGHEALKRLRKLAA